MAWPTIFANLAAGNQPLSLFDNMFAQVAQLVAIPCTASGANTIVLTGIGNSPALTAYNNFQMFRFKAAGSSNAAVTVQFAGLAALPVFQKDGVTQCAAGSLISGQEYLVCFDQSRNANAGGFYLEDAAQPLAQGASPVWGPFTTIASAATTDLSTATTIAVVVSGNATITSFGAGVNLGKVVRFSGAPLLTNNNTSLVLPGGANIQAAANDMLLALSDASGNWYVISYTKHSGQPNATGAAGIPLIGSGAGVDNAFGTAIVAGGGTGAVTLTAHGVLVGEGTGPIVATAVGSAGQVLTSNGAGNDPTFQAVPGGGALVPAAQLLTASQTVTIPTGATKCKVTLIGGGGGSGGGLGAASSACTPSGSGAGGPGGAAGMLEKYLSGLTPGNTLILTIGGAGSAGNSTPTAGGNGGDTTLASGTQTITTLTAAHGSGGGAGNLVAGSVGASGTATNGDLNITGGSGASAVTSGANVGSSSGCFVLSISGSVGMLGPGQNNAGGATAVGSVLVAAGKAGTGFGAGAAGGLNFGNTTGAAGAVGTAGAAIFEWYI